MRVPAQSGPGHGTERNSRATSLPGDAMRHCHPRTRTQPMLASERSGGARLSTMRTTIVQVLADLASLRTHPRFDCGLRSISMTRSTMSWQGQAEQPMMLRGLSVSSLAAKAHCGQQKASTALERPHRHAPVRTRPACCMAAQSQRCGSASTPTTQLQITPCPDRGYLRIHRVYLHAVKAHT